MDVNVTDTHTTEATASLSYAELLDVVGLAVKVKAGIKGDQPGTTTTLVFGPVDDSGEFQTTVNVVVDHNYVPPKPAPSPVVDPAVPATSSAPPAPASPSSDASPVTPTPVATGVTVPVSPAVVI